jgi:hypothetical protein
MPCITLPLTVTGITIISLHNPEPTAQEGHVECKWKIRMNTKIWSENFKERDHLEDPGIDGRIILKWSLE